MTSGPGAGGVFNIWTARKGMPHTNKTWSLSSRCYGTTTGLPTVARFCSSYVFSEFLFVYIDVFWVRPCEMVSCFMVNSIFVSCMTEVFYLPCAFKLKNGRQKCLLLDRTIFLPKEVTFFCFENYSRTWRTGVFFPNFFLLPWWWSSVVYEIPWQNVYLSLVTSI